MIFRESQCLLKKVTKTEKLRDAQWGIAQLLYCWRWGMGILPPVLVDG